MNDTYGVLLDMTCRVVRAYMNACDFKDARDESTRNGHREAAAYQWAQFKENNGKHTAHVLDISSLISMPFDTVNAVLRRIVGENRDSENIVNVTRIARDILSALGVGAQEVTS